MRAHPHTHFVYIYIYIYIHIYICQVLYSNMSIGKSYEAAEAQALIALEPSISMAGTG